MEFNDRRPGAQGQLFDTSTLPAMQRPEPARPNVTPDPGFVERSRARSTEYASPGAAVHRAGARADLQRAATEGRPSINTSDAALPAIVASGRMKSQFETGTSGGSLNPAMRSTAEKGMFGYAEDLPHHERPIYGHMATGNDEGPAMYGKNKFVLKPSVLGRTTLTHSDSLGANVVPVAHADAAAGKVDPAIHGDFYSTGFHEAQYHGGVGLGDVAHVDTAAEGYRHDTDRVTKNLDQAKVPWRVMHKETYVQPQLGASSQAEHSPMWYRHGGGDAIVSSQQFVNRTSKGFKSPWGVRRTPQMGYGPTGVKEYTDLGNAERRRQMGNT